jgi:hypothetical protein
VFVDKFAILWDLLSELQYHLGSFYFLFNFAKSFIDFYLMNFSHFFIVGQFIQSLIKLN